MTFEKQICEKCKDLTICFLHIANNPSTKSNGWYCDNCYGWVIENANKKDHVAEIFAGIEDLD